MVIRISRRLILSAGLLGLAGCGSYSPPSQPPPKPTSVTISPTSATVKAGAMQMFTATVMNDYLNQGVTWALSGSGCSGATCGSLSNMTTSSVTYTAPATVPNPATVTLTATSVNDSTKTGSAMITVTAAAAAGVSALSTTSGNLNFTNTPLMRPDGNSEPEISIAADGTMGIVGLSWLTFGTNLWTGPFGSTPTFQGVIDASLQQPGKRVFGGGDADVDMGSTGTLHASTLIFLVNPTLNAFQLGVSAITCPSAIRNFNLKNCTTQIIDTTQSDRQWVTSDGPRVFISHHDSGKSALIHVQRSDDDGFTFQRVGDPIVGQGRATGDVTFNNDQGPIVADRFTHNVYDIFAAGETGILKAKTTNFDHIFVSRSTDGGETWTAALVFHASTPVGLNNVFPTLAADPTNGKLYAAWSDAHNGFFSMSADQGQTWTSAVIVNVAPANTAVFPWIAADNGTVDLVYYGTTASSKDDSSAVWNVYMAQTTDDGLHFTQSRASNTPNHVGVICTQGAGCAPGTRNLLDLFKVAIDPQNGRAAIIYTDDTLTKDSSGNPLPQVVLAQQN